MTFTIRRTRTIITVHGGFALDGGRLVHAGPIRPHIDDPRLVASGRRGRRPAVVVPPAHERQHAERHPQAADRAPATGGEGKRSGS
ncbi:MAG: hypothetical protein JWO02_3076 [Solirubrobacterales bacterium]|nr:hypothetical protein [Solirubrobacterales bacterium]